MQSILKDQKRVASSGRLGVDRGGPWATMKVATIPAIMRLALLTRNPEVVS